MRKIALDLGSRKTAYCEARDGKVVGRGTVEEVRSLEPLLGPEQPEAVVAIEACREAWYVHDLLASWGNQVVLVDTTRSRRLGIGQHGRKTERIDAEVLALALERGGFRSRTCCRHIGGSFVAGWAYDERWSNHARKW